MTAPIISPGRTATPREFPGANFKTHDSFIRPNLFGIILRFVKDIGVTQLIEFCPRFASATLLLR